MHTLDSESFALLDAWLQRLGEQNRRPRTIQAYGFVVRAAFTFWREHRQRRNVREISLSDIERWSDALRERGTAPITREFYLFPLISFFVWAEQQGHLFENPARSFVLLKTPRRLLPVPSEQEVKALLERVSGSGPLALRDRAMLEVLYGAGLRCGEMASLEVSSIDFGVGAIRVSGKGGKERVALLPRLALTAVKAYLDHGRSALAPAGEPTPNALWLTVNGNAAPRATLRAITARRAKDVGLRLTPHALRRAFATHMLRRGASPIDLQRLLGHATFRQMRHYLRYAILDLKAAHRRSRVSR